MSTGQPKSRKRRAPAEDDSGSNSKADKKRVQNRISQQCLREKQLARTRQLETAMEIIKSSTDNPANGQEGKAASMEAQIKLITENEQLREALFRMRKKLLSISHAAASAADDKVFDMLLNGDSHTSTTSTDNMPASPRPARACKDPEPDTNPHPVVQESIGIDQSHPTFGEESTIRGDSSNFDMSGFDPYQSFQEVFPNAPDRAFPANMDTAGIPSGFGPLDTIFPGTVDGYFGMFNQIDNINQSCGPRALKCVDSHLRSDPALISSTTVGFTVISSKFVDKTLRACSTYYRSVVTVPERRDQRSGMHPQSVDSAISRTTKSLAATAVQLMSSMAGMQSYVHCVDAATPMEMIMRWRLSNSLADRLAIPEPFRPTPLQYSSRNYPPSIDMVNWAAIRDQLIINADSLDHDTMMRDIVLNTVSEDHSRRLCLSVYDVFYNKIWPLEKVSHASTKQGERPSDPAWRYSEANASCGPRAAIESSENDLLREISTRMQLEHHISLEANHRDSTGGEFHTYDSIRRQPNVRSETSAQGLQSLVVRYGLGELSSWKLSREFARKYPFLDCSSAVARYDMVPCSQIAGF